MSNYHRMFFAIAVYIIMLWYYQSEAQAQVTFSRDWNPGKRVVDNQEYHSTMRAASTVCHLLLTQIRHLASCDAAKPNEVDDGTTVFSGPR